MSDREMKRAAVLAQVAAEAWTLVEAAERMELSYRQAKRVWKRYRKQGAAGLAHRSAGRISNRAKPGKLRTKVLRLIRQKYTGDPGERCWPRGCGAGRGKYARTGADEPARSTSANWFKWTAASTIGWKGGDREAA